MAKKQSTLEESVVEQEDIEDELDDIDAEENETEEGEANPDDLSFEDLAKFVPAVGKEGEEDGWAEDEDNTDDDDAEDDDDADDKEEEGELREGEEDSEESSDEEDDAEEEELFTVTVDGEERTVSSEDLIESYERAQASNDRFQEAARLNKETKAIFEEVGRDPMGVLMQLARKSLSDEEAREWVATHAASLVAQVEEEAELSDDERARVRKLRKLETLEEENRRYAEEAKKRAEEEKLNSRRAATATILREVFPKKGVTAESKVGRLVLERLDREIVDGHTPTRGEILAVVEEARQDFATERRELLSSLSDEDFDLLPEELKKQLNKRKVNRRVKRRRSAKKADTGKLKKASAPSARRGAELDDDMPDLRSITAIRRWERETGRAYEPPRTRR